MKLYFHEVVGLSSWPVQRYRKRVRDSYNSSNYKKSLKQGLFLWRLFGDKVGLDVAARSSLRLRKYHLSAKLYRIANKNNIKLRDNAINHFEAEVKSGGLLEAFKLVKSTQNIYPEKNTLALLVKEIGKVPKDELFSLIKKMNEYDNLPSEIANMVPDIVTEIPIKDNEKVYTLLQNDVIDSERYKREIIRLSESSSYRIGQHLTDSYRKPWKILFLPLSLPLLALNLVKENNPPVDLPSFLPSNPSKINSLRRCIVLFPTNGVGFGHFTRLLSIAKRMRSMDSQLEIIFFTTMPTLHITENDGFPSYHIPGRYRYEDMGAKEWNSLAEEMLSLIFSLHRPSAFIFDGSYPYRGMLNAIKNHPNVVKVWLRRGALKSDTKSIPSDSLSHFDGVIIPGDSVQNDSEKESDLGIATMRCNPITLLDSDDVSDKGTFRSRMGIPEEATVAYVQLGAGRINNINNDLLHTLEALNNHKNIYTVFAESIIGDRHYFNFDRLRTLRDYPNSMFFNDFDFAVMAGGYNSYHEAIQSGLPTLCFPNLNTGKDDQLLRCNVAHKAGMMAVIETRSRKKIHAAIDRMADSKVRDTMRSRASILQRENGAKEAAKWILSSIK